MTILVVDASIVVEIPLNTSTGEVDAARDKTAVADLTYSAVHRVSHRRLIQSALVAATEPVGL